MADLAALQSCTELTTEHAAQAASSMAELRTLLDRVSSIAAPGEGCPKVLMAVAKLVGQDWLDGDLRAELSGDETSTSLSLFCDYGVGIRERLMPATHFAVPLDEFERALHLAPRLILPLHIGAEDGKVVLARLAPPEAGTPTVTLPAVTLDDASLGDGERTTAPPPADELLVVDEATPEELERVAQQASASGPPLEDIDGDWPDTDAQTAPPASSYEAKVEAEHMGRMQSGQVRVDGEPAPPSERRNSNVHTRPTVRRMVAVDIAAAVAGQRRDPRREDE